MSQTLSQVEPAFSPTKSTSIFDKSSSRTHGNARTHFMADISGCPPLTRQSVLDAHERIKSFIHRTPVLTSTTLDGLASSALDHPTKLYFKCENYQRIGAFKARGAFHALSRLHDEELKNGVVTHSSGNHAAALALAARTRGVTAYIVMPSISQPNKISATRGYGAEIIFSGSTSQEREAVVHDVIQRTGAILVPPYDHPDIICGQGTLGLELQEQIRSECSDEDEGGLDAVVAPCGGGGMLSGVALAFEGQDTLVFGAEPSFEGANDAERGLSSSPPSRITTVKSLTIADGLRTPLGEITWKVVSNKNLVQGVYSVSEEEIKDAMRLLIERMKTVVEPSAAVGLAVVLYNKRWQSEMQRLMRNKGNGGTWKIGLVLSGGNTTLEALAKLFG